MTAGSVGESAAPSSPANVHEKPSSQCPASVSRPAVAKVPITPSQSTGTIAVRMRRRPILVPPSKRITTSAAAAIRSTVSVEISPRPGERVREQRRGEQEQGRPGNAQPLAETARRDSERETRGDEQHDDAEIVRLVHSGDSMDAEASSSVERRTEIALERSRSAGAGKASGVR